MENGGVVILFVWFLCQKGAPKIMTNGIVETLFEILACVDANVSERTLAPYALGHESMQILYVFHVMKVMSLFFILYVRVIVFLKSIR